MAKNLNFETLIVISIFILALFLRIYKLGSTPPSPYWEEVALGYDAYSILKTGKDHHGNFLPLLVFESFGDYKPSGYFYFTVPSIAIFGLNTFAVRFPSAFFGSLTILILYFLTKEILQKNKYKEKIALVSALLLAISPWQLLLSRVAFESNLALFFLTLGSLLFIKFINSEKKYLLPLSIISWIISFYTYHSNRIIIPILGLSFGTLYFNKIKKTLLISIISILLFIFSLIPILSNLKNPQVNTRFQQTSAFTTLKPIEISNYRIARSQSKFLAKIIHHRFSYYLKIFTDNYISHFNPVYLFISGDKNLRHSTQFTGQLYLFSLPLLIIGFYYFIKNFNKVYLPIIFLLFISPVPAALTKSAPHALRSLTLIIPLSIISAFGITKISIQLNKSLKKRFLIPIFYFIFFIILLFEFIRFQHYYYNFYPTLTQNEWQFGYKQLMQYIKEKKNEYEQIKITREKGRPAMYYWFYSQTDPKIVQKWNLLSPKDQGEYLQFENLYFSNNPQLPQTQLIVNTKKPENKLIKKIIYNLDNQPEFYVYEN